MFFVFNKVKIAISFVSAEKAIEYLENEIDGFDYEKVKEQACDLWAKSKPVLATEGQNFFAASIEPHIPCFLDKYGVLIYNVTVFDIKCQNIFRRKK